MVHDTHASDTAPEPDSPTDDDISHIDWQSPAGAIVEASIDRNIWPSALVNSFQHTALKIFDNSYSSFCRIIYRCSRYVLRRLH